MTKLADHSSSSVTKLMLIGDTGSGKTGALASLAGAGYNLRVLDLDNGADVLANILLDAKSPYGPDAAARVDIETLTDKMRNVNGKLMPAKAEVWQKAMKILNDWPEYGPISTWTPKDVLVIDSLTMLSTAAMNFTLMLNGRLGQRPQLGDWGEAQTMLETLMQMLYDEQVNCNVIVNTHITYIGEEHGPQRGYPSCAGNKLPQKIGRYFNSILLARSIGSGSGLRRKIITTSQALIELKTSAPNRVKPDYPIESGLADFFRDAQGGPAAA